MFCVRARRKKNLNGNDEINLISIIFECMGNGLDFLKIENIIMGFI